MHSTRVIPGVAIVVSDTVSDQPIVSNWPARPMQASADLATHRLQRLGVASLGAMLRHSAQHTTFDVALASRHFGTERMIVQLHAMAGLDYERGLF